MAGETARDGFRRLAFGDIRDAVKLLFCEDGSPRGLSKMDLFSVSEISRAKSGEMKIRFFDRLEALRALSELEETENGADDLLAAIHRGAAALGGGGKP